MSLTLAEAVALTSLIFNVIVAAVGLTWGIGKIRDTVRDEIEEHRREVDERLEALRGNMGEVGASLRTKIGEVELFSRDTFMRRDSFYRTMEMLSADMKDQFNKIGTRLDRMENKIDAVGGAVKQ